MVCAHERPAMVLLDIMLPGIDGMEVCRRLKGAPTTADIPIIMLTAKGDEVDKILGLELGADDYITKPFSVRELIARVKALLRRAAPQNDRARTVRNAPAGVHHPAKTGWRGRLSGVNAEKTAPLQSQAPGKAGGLRKPWKGILPANLSGGTVFSASCITCHAPRKQGSSRCVLHLLVLILSCFARN